MKIVTAAEMREIDRITTERYGVPSFTLMENAGSAVAEFCLEQYPEAQRIGIICGKGNNGGDGFVAARKLHEAGKSVAVLLLADPADVKGDAAEMLKRLPVQPVIARSEEELKSDGSKSVFETDLLVDAILGTGFKPPVTGLYAEAIDLLWGDVPVVSIDVPSGSDADAHEIDVDRSIWPEAIVSFTAAKPLLVSSSNWLAAIAIARIGSPQEAVTSSLGREVITAHPYEGLNTARPAQSNKGRFGHVLIVGGSRGKAGAVAMAGMAALRVGAGLCTVATARGVQAVVSSFAPELMTEDLAETDAGTVSFRALEYGRIDEVVKGKTVLAIGPGMSRHQESAEFVRTLVHRRQAAVVLDADGLNAFEGHDERLDGSGIPLILTPHPGEMARLTGLSVEEVQADRIGVARKFAHDHNCIVVLKGWRTLVAEPNGRTWINVTGNAAMAKGGTGDILTGMIAGAIAQCPEDLVRAVCDAVYLHGLAGDIGRDEVGERSLLATDLLKYLPEAFADSEEVARHSAFEWINPHLRARRHPADHADTLR